MEWLVWLSVGWFLGSSAMWLYFHSQRLIRSRSEWYAVQKALGRPVPDNWQEDFPDTDL
jgi:hypothetical protein